MSTTSTIIVIAGLVAIGVGFSTYQYKHEHDDKAVYELKEKCAKAALSRFDRDHPNGDMSKGGDMQSIYSFQNHYNKPYNTCMYVELTTVLDFGVKPTFVTNFRKLYDISENKNMAEFTQSAQQAPSTCWVEKNECKSQNEWDSLVEKYMSDAK